MASIDTKPMVETAASSGTDLRRSRLRTWLMALDAVAILVGVGLVSAVRPPGDNWPVAVGLLALAYVVWLGRVRLYRSRFITRRADEIRRIVYAGVRTAATVGLAAFALELAIDRTWLAVTSISTVLLLTAEREVVRRRLTRWRLSGRMSRRVLLIGNNTEAEQFNGAFADQPDLGYEIVGRVDPAAAGVPTELTTVVLATARRTNAIGVVVAATAMDMASSNRLIRDLVEDGMHVELSSTLADIASDRLTVRPLGRFPVVYVEPRHRHGWRASAKRGFDVTVAGMALALLAPVLVAVAVVVKATSPGPVLFRQERVGKDGEPFQVLKYRTMVVDAEKLLTDLARDNESAGPLFKMKDDPRVTRVGSYLRKTSLDELPQLWNVMRNEMSLVGPRPALRAEMSEWADELYGRLRVKPGITGMWQVSGRSSTTFEEYTRLDLYYVDNWSLVVDLVILAKTIPAVLSSDGAY